MQRWRGMLRVSHDGIGSDDWLLVGNAGGKCTAVGELRMSQERAQPLSPLSPPVASLSKQPAIGPQSTDLALPLPPSPRSCCSPDDCTANGKDANDTNWHLVQESGESAVQVSWINLTWHSSRGSVDAGPNPTWTSTEWEEDFVCVPATVATRARLISRSHPAVASAFLWLWLTLLTFGELATTFWWLQSLGLCCILTLGALLGVLTGLARLVLSLEQTITVGVAMLLAATPALPAFSAVLLMLPPNRAQFSQEESHWEIMHSPVTMAFGMIYLVPALLSALRTEYPCPNCRIRWVIFSLEAMKNIAWSVCIFAVWIYCAITLCICAAHIWVWGRERQLPQLSTSVWRGLLAGPVASGRGVALTLHALGLLCAEARQRTTAALGDEFLPRLLGVQRARALSPRRLALKYGRRLVSYVPTLRRCTPPTIMVAIIVALRRTAPVLFPVLALLPWITFRFCDIGLPGLPLLMCGGLIALLSMAIVREQRALPRSTLRRLPLLFLPPGSGVPPRTRKLVGYALTVAGRAEGIFSHAAVLRPHW